MRQLIALAALVATAACSSDTSTTEPLVGSLAGSYSLRTLNGTTLPFTLVSHDTTVQLDTDVILMTDGGEWNEVVNYRQTVGTTATTNESFMLSGVWTRSGNNVSFRVQNGVLYLGTATDSSLNLSDNFYNYVFVR